MSIRPSRRCCFTAPIGDRLTCIFVDNGLLRFNEAEQIRDRFERLQLPLVFVDASDLFLDRLAGVTDPEQKRKIIGATFIDVFEAEAREARASSTSSAQGTLYPDVIESVSVVGPSHVIKSHHNVGGLPERMRFKLVEPLRRAVQGRSARASGRRWDSTTSSSWRQPFPGPGPGGAAARRVDARRGSICCAAPTRSSPTKSKRPAGIARLWQSFAVLLPVQSVGVMGDARTYEYTIAIRAVESRDGMTADWARLPHDLLATISSRIVNEVRGINRVVYDISSKPPATIEWE